MKKYFLFLSIIILFSQTIQVFAESGPIDWVYPFPFEAKIIATHYPETPQFNHNQVAVKNEDYKSSGAFEDGQMVSVIYIEGSIAGAKYGRCLVEGTDMYSGKPVTGYVDCGHLQYVGDPRAKEITWGGKTVEEFATYYFGEVSTSNITFSEFIVENSLSRKSASNFLGIRAIKEFINYILTVDVAEINWLADEFLEPGTQPAIILGQHFELDPYVYQIVNDTDQIMVYNFATSAKQYYPVVEGWKDPNLQWYVNLEPIAPNSRLLLFHIRYDATNKPDFSIWADWSDFVKYEDAINSKSFPSVLTNFVFFSTQTQLIYPSQEIDMMDNDRTMYEMFGYYDPETRWYDLFIPVQVYENDIPLWVMYSLANVYVDENGVDKSLQIWEYDEENIVDLPPYTFSDGYFEPYSIAQDWHWIVERVGFNDDLQKLVSQSIK